MTWKAAVRRGRHRRQHPLLSRGAVLRIFLPVALLVATLASVAVLGPAGTQAASASPQPYNGTCPGGLSACVQVSLPCQTAPCPSVVAGPTSALENGQYVYLQLNNFPAGDSVRGAFCTTDGSQTIVPDPYCASLTPAGVTLSNPIVVAGADGSGIMSAPVVYDPSNQSNSPITAETLVYDNQPSSTFFCDNGPDYCGFVITDTGTTPNETLDTSTNTVIVPLNFSAGPSACPTSDPSLSTDSSFTVEHLIPYAVQATCNQSNGVQDLNTATNTLNEMSDLGDGGTSLAFTDDPLDPQILGKLPQKTGFAYIPVALSATVMAFRGQVPDLNNGAVDFPVAHYNMTPNMVAGVLTTAYAEAGAQDNLVTAPPGDTPPLNCAELVGCSKKNIFPFNTFFMLNPEAPGVGQSLAIGSFFSNTTSGTNYQLSDWLCSAPNAPFQLTVSEVGNPQPQNIEVTDTYNTAAGTFTTAPTNSPFWNTLTPPSQWPFKTCQATSQFPTLSAGQAGGYKPADTPALQAASISTYGTGSNLAFGAMDWSDASYNGLNVASLQNASGSFVAPTDQSIDAALDDATANINGVLTFNYDDASNTTAYPMPMVTYAVVPTTPLPSAQAQTETNFLTNLVDVSSGKVGTLPGGYVPLTSDLATQALQDISADIVAEPSNAPATSTGGSSTNPTTPAGSNGGTTGTSGGETTGNNLPSYSIGVTPATAANGTSPSTSSTTNGNASPTPGGDGLVPVAGVAVLVADTRFVLPVLIALTLASIVAGPTLLAWPRRRKRLSPAAPAATDLEEGGS